MSRNRSRSFVITPCEVPYFTVPARRNFKRFLSGTINKTPSMQDARDAVQDCVMSFRDGTKCLSSLVTPTLRLSPRGSPRRGRLGPRSLSTSIRTSPPPVQSSLLKTRSMTMDGRSNRSLYNTTSSQPKQRLPIEQRFSSLGNIHPPTTQRPRDFLPEVPALFDMPNLLSVNPRCKSSSSRWCPKKQTSTAGSHSTLCSTNVEPANSASYRARWSSDSTALEFRRSHPASPLLPTNHEDESTPTPAPRESINVALNFKAHEKQLEVDVHGLTCEVPAGENNLLVELTLNPGKQRHVLRDIPASVDIDSNDANILPPKRAVFKGVKSASLSSKILTIKVYTKGLLRRSGKLMYQTCMPLADVAVYGDAEWVPLTSSTAERVSIVVL